MSNNYAVSTNSNLVVTESSMFGQPLDAVRVIFDYLFNDNTSLKEKNKFVLMSFQRYIKEGKLGVIKDLISDDAIIDIHISCLKTMLIMVENVSGIEEYRAILSRIYKTKGPNH